MQIFVLGMHRSGTSVVTRLINLMGAYIGPEGIQHEPLDENPKGFWERRDVRALNDRILSAHGCSWQDVTFWEPDGIDQETRQNLEDEARQILFRFEGFRPWVVKEPRLCLTLPYYLAACEAPIAVLVVRNPAEVATSLDTRNGMEPPDAYELWHAYNQSALEVTASMPRIVVDYADFMAKPARSTYRLYALLRQAGCHRLQMPSDVEIKAFVSTELQRSTENASAPPADVQEQFNLLRSLVSRGVDETSNTNTNRPRIRDLLHLYRQACADQRAATLSVDEQSPFSPEERITIDGRLAKVEAENERLINALLDIQEQAEDQSRHKLQLGSERDKLEQRLTEMASRAETLAVELSARLKEIETIRESMSWKVTKPARAVLGAFRVPLKRAKD